MNCRMRLPSLKIFFALLFLGLSVIAFAQLVPKKPAVLYPVYDQVNLLTAAEKEQLNQKLILSNRINCYYKKGVKGHE